MAIVRTANIKAEIGLQQEIYSDFLDNLDIDPIKQDMVCNVNEEAVKSSIKNLLLTNRGERLFNPDLGSDIRALLFENSSPALESVLGDLIKSTINNYEPRANVLDVTVDSNNDADMLVATITFSVINRTEPITLELILNRIR